MQEKGIGSVADRHAATDEAIIGLLVEDRGIWSTGEMQRGLVSQCGDFVFAARPALEAAGIWGPCAPAGG